MERQFHLRYKVTSTVRLEKSNHLNFKNGFALDFGSMGEEKCLLINDLPLSVMGY